MLPFLHKVKTYVKMVEQEKMQPLNGLRPESMDSEEQMAAAIDDLVEQAKQKGWCRRAPITNTSKRLQTARMLILIMTPILVLLCVSFYFVSDHVKAKLESDKVRETVRFSVEVGRLIHVMQRERDITVLYLSMIGPQTKAFLTKCYVDTNNQINSLSRWPTNLDIQARRYFRTQRYFQGFLIKHRNELQFLNQTLYEEIVFYTDGIGVFVKWLYDAIVESKYGTIWKNLVAYEKIVVAKENVGVERALGSAYFSVGGFVSQEIYEWYNKQLHMFKANLRAAGRYSALVEPIANARISSGGKNLTDYIEVFRNDIQHRTLSVPSLRSASDYYDNMTAYIDLIFLAQSDLAKEILKSLDARSDEMTTGVIISCIIIVIVLIMCPLLVRTVRSLTDDIQNCALEVAKKNKKLSAQCQRTDVLLFEMMPRRSAEIFKIGKRVHPEYFKQVTVCFSRVVDLVPMMQNREPERIVRILNSIYYIMDCEIEKYDVFKIDSVGDSYVVASGFPERSKHRNAIEVANLTMGLVRRTQTLNFPELNGKNVRIKIGISTGSCTGGVVGYVFPKYILCGDAIAMASHMEHFGKHGQILVGRTTAKILKGRGYLLQSRSPVKIEGRGEVEAFWLLGHTMLQTFVDPGAEGLIGGQRIEMETL